MSDEKMGSAEAMKIVELTAQIVAAAVHVDARNVGDVTKLIDNVSRELMRTYERVIGS